MERFVQALGAGYLRPGKQALTPGMAHAGVQRPPLSAHLPHKPTRKRRVGPRLRRPVATKAMLLIDLLAATTVVQRRTAPCAFSLWRPSLDFVRGLVVRTGWTLAFLRGELVCCGEV